MGKFRGESKLSTWIATIAFNTCISHLRKKEWNLGMQDEDFHETEETPETPATFMGKEEVKKYLLQMIEKLPVQHRIVLTLFHLQEFSYREIADITGMPEGTIKSYLSRARNALKKEIIQFSEREKSNIFAEYAKN
jgi:RNA polymerase sigma factor (sigma-70 family)